MTQSVNEQVGTVPAIEPKLHLRKVSGKMLGTDLVPRSHDAALEQRERRFYGIGVNVSAEPDVLLGAVVNRLVPDITYSVFVGGKIICDQHVNILANILADVLCERPAPCIWVREGGGTFPF